MHARADTETKRTRDPTVAKPLSALSSFISAHSSGGSPPTNRTFCDLVCVKRRFGLRFLLCCLSVSGYGDDSVLRAQTLSTFLSRSSLKNDAVITLGRADLTPGQSYSFTVNVTNMLGLSDATTVTVQKTAASIPNVRAKAPHVRSSRGEDIILSNDKYRSGAVARAMTYL